MVPPALLAHVFKDQAPAYAATGMDTTSMASAVSFLNMAFAPFKCAFKVSVFLLAVSHPLPGRETGGFPNLLDVAGEADGRALFLGIDEVVVGIPGGNGRSGRRGVHGGMHIMTGGAGEVATIQGVLDPLGAGGDAGAIVGVEGAVSQCSLVVFDKTYG